MHNYIFAIKQAWQTAFSNRLFRIKLFLTPGVFVLYAALTQPLGSYIQARKGTQLEDQLLSVFPVGDFSFPIFSLLYLSLLTIFIAHLNKPIIITRVLEMHLYVAIIRQCCILLVALEPPQNLIVLRDIFLENTVYPQAAPLTKDLFFSGHVASIWIYFLCTQSKWLKMYFLIATLLMSFMVLCMRVHYTYDVYGAVLITSLIYFVPQWLRMLQMKERLRKILLVSVINK